MGLGAMMAGGNPSSERSKDDWYPTPPDVTIALLEVLGEDLKGVTHDPACGDWAINTVLEYYGHKTVGSDINPRSPQGVKRNYFTVKKPVSHNIITNPPFDQAEGFIEHALSLEPRHCAMMLKATYWHAANRTPLFQNSKPWMVCPLTWRPDFMRRGRPTMDVIWVIWRRGHNGDPTYRLLSRPECPADLAAKLNFTQPRKSTRKPKSKTGKQSV